MSAEIISALRIWIWGSIFLIITTAMLHLTAQGVLKDMLAEEIPMKQRNIRIGARILAMGVTVATTLVIATW